MRTFRASWRERKRKRQRPEGIFLCIPTSLACLPSLCNVSPIQRGLLPATEILLECSKLPKVLPKCRPEYTQCILQFFQPFPCPVNEISLSHVPEIFPSQPSTAVQHQGTWAPGSWWSRPHSGHILPAPVRHRGLSRAPGPGTRCEQLGRDSKFVNL